MVVYAQTAKQWLPTSFKVGAAVLLVILTSACVGATVKQETEKISLVEAWKMKMTRQGADHVVISYSPMLESAKKYTGANFKSDGITLRVSLQSCLGAMDCPSMLPAEVHRESGKLRWYEVVVPYRGEKVLVDGNGPVVEELPLAP
jgi:hypothetical protein